MGPNPERAVHTRSAGRRGAAARRPAGHPARAPNDRGPPGRPRPHQGRAHHADSILRCQSHAHERRPTRRAPASADRHHRRANHRRNHTSCRQVPTHQHREGSPEQPSPRTALHQKHSSAPEPRRSEPATPLGAKTPPARARTGNAAAGALSAPAPHLSAPGRAARRRRRPSMPEPRIRRTVPGPCRVMRRRPRPDPRGGRGVGGGGGRRPGRGGRGDGAGPLPVGRRRRGRPGGGTPGAWRRVRSPR